MIYFLILFFCCVFIVAYILSNGDFFAPPILVTTGFLASGIFALMLGDLWNRSLQQYTICVYVCGISSFLVGYYLVFGIHRHYTATKSLDYVYISNRHLYLYIIISVLIAALYWMVIIKNFGLDDGWTGMMSRFRMATVYAESYGIESFKMPKAISTGRLIIQSGGYVLVYVLANNKVIAPKSQKKTLVVAILVSLLITFITAQRLDLIRVPIAFMAIYFILKKRNGLLVQKKQLALYAKYGIVVILILGAFAGLKSVFGRTASGISAIKYIAKYIGGPIPLFDDYLRYPAKHTRLWGEETFWGIYDFLFKLTKKQEYSYDYTLEFRTINGVKMGNVYSAFRMYYADFNIQGVIILSLVLGSVFGIMYSLIVKKKNCESLIIRFGIFKYHSKVEFMLIIYSVCIHACLMLFYQDWFYAHLLTWYQIKSFIYMWIFKFIVIDMNKKNRMKGIKVNRE